MSTRIYLDNAATSWPKPDCVYTAVDDYQRQLGCAAGRGAYRSAEQATRIVDTTRQRLAAYLNAPRDSQIVFAFNGTDALNLCVFGSLDRGDHVVTTVVEHNSLLRPLHALERRGDIEVTYAEGDANGRIDPEQLESLLRPHTRLVALSHASNVTGGLQPIEAIAQITRSRGIRLLVDAAQTVGQVPIDVTRIPVDMLVASGHKGLLGPLGTGFAYLTEEMSGTLRPFRYGGTGGDGQSLDQPTAGPSRFESGNLNVAGLAGLGAAIEYLQDHAGPLQDHEQRLTRLALERLQAIDGVRCVGPAAADERVGLISFVVAGLEAHEVAAGLDVLAHIEVRSGLHCAPRMHARLGLKETVRASWGAFTTVEEIHTLGDTLLEMAMPA